MSEQSNDTKPGLLSPAELTEIRFSDRHYGGTPDEGAMAALGRRKLLAHLDALAAGEVPDGEALGRRLSDMLGKIPTPWEELSEGYRRRATEAALALYTKGRSTGRAEGEAERARLTRELSDLRATYDVSERQRLTETNAVERLTAELAEARAEGARAEREACVEAVGAAIRFESDAPFATIVVRAINARGDGDQR